MARPQDAGLAHPRANSSIRVCREQLLLPDNRARNERLVTTNKRKRPNRGVWGTRNPPGTARAGERHGCVPSVPTGGQEPYSGLWLTCKGWLSPCGRESGTSGGREPAAATGRQLGHLVALRSGLLLGPEHRLPPCAPTAPQLREQAQGLFHMGPRADTQQEGDYI